MAGIVRFTYTYIDGMCKRVDRREYFLQGISIQTASPQTRCVRPAGQLMLWTSSTAPGATGTATAKAAQGAEAAAVVVHLLLLRPSTNRSPATQSHLLDLCPKNVFAGICMVKRTANVIMASIGLSAVLHSKSIQSYTHTHTQAHRKSEREKQTDLIPDWPANQLADHSWCGRLCPAVTTVRCRSLCCFVSTETYRVCVCVRLCTCAYTVEVGGACYATCFRARHENNTTKESKMAPAVNWTFAFRVKCSNKAKIRRNNGYITHTRTHDTRRKHNRRPWETKAAK